MGSILLLLASLQPYTPVIEDRVDLIEVNHLYTENGVLSFDQLIFYEWSDHFCRYNVVDWRMLKRQSQNPVRDGRGWRVTWIENVPGDYKSSYEAKPLFRSVKAKSIRETWTQIDPEITERDILSKDLRRELSKTP